MHRLLPPLLPMLLMPMLALATLALSGCSSGTDSAGARCSLVRVEQGRTFCAPQEPPPSPPPFCTRSLGSVDCWSNPEALNGPAPRGVADGPHTLTPGQEIDRTAHWPNL